MEDATELTDIAVDSRRRLLEATSNLDDLSSLQHGSQLLSTMKSNQPWSASALQSHIEYSHQYLQDDDSLLMLSASTSAHLNPHLICQVHGDNEDLQSLTVTGSPTLAPTKETPTPSAKATSTPTRPATPVPTEKPTCVRVDAQWSAWNPWTPCTKTCGGGQRHRTRYVKRQASCKGSGLSGRSSENGSCNTGCCAVNMLVGHWTSWGTCNRPTLPSKDPVTQKSWGEAMGGKNGCGGIGSGKTCDVKSPQHRTRQVTQSASCGGTTQKTHEKRYCNFKLTFPKIPSIFG